MKGILWNNNKLDIKDKYGNTWNIIWKKIKKLQKIGYYVDWKLLNTRDYGIPQNRERVYIVGSLKANYIWPEKCKMDNINNYIENKVEDNDLYFSKTRLQKLEKYINCIFIDLSFLNQGTNKSNLYSCCLNTRNQIYCIPKNRLATINELLMLQGFNINLKQVVSNSQIKKQIGNSMSVNVLKSIYNNLFKCH